MSQISIASRVPVEEHEVRALSGLHRLRQAGDALVYVLDTLLAYYFCLKCRLLILTGTGTGMFSRLYPPPHISKYNQKLAAEGDDQLAEPTLPILFKSVMFEY